MGTNYCQDTETNNFEDDENDDDDEQEDNDDSDIEDIIPSLELCVICSGWGRNIHTNVQCVACRGRGEMLEHKFYYWSENIMYFRCGYELEDIHPPHLSILKDWVGQPIVGNPDGMSRFRGHLNYYNELTVMLMRDQKKGNVEDILPWIYPEGTVTYSGENGVLETKVIPAAQ